MFVGDISGLISVDNSKQRRHWKKLQSALACALVSGGLQISNNRYDRRNLMGLNFSISGLFLEGKIDKYFFRWLGRSRFILGIQNNLKIRGSSRVSLRVVL